MNKRSLLHFPKQLLLSPKNLIGFFIILFLTLPMFVNLQALYGQSNSKDATNQVAKTIDKSIINSQAAILMDADTGQILFEKNMHEKLPPASITKISTALIALEKGNLSDTLTMSRNAVFSIPRGSSHIALDEDEELKLEEALYAMMLVSANDAANGIAEYVSGSTNSFAELMNQRAAELGAKNTHFVNANGLDEDGHYTTAYDMAMITKEAMQYPKFCEIWSTKRYEMAPTNEQPEVRFFNNQNRMLINSKYHYDCVIGGKLGWTTKAQNTMVVVAKQNNRTLLCVLLKSQDPQVKYDDAMLLFEYGFNNFRKVLVNDLKLPGSFAFLLHNQIKPDQVVTTYSNITKKDDGTTSLQAEFSIPSINNEYMYTQIGTTTLTSDPATVSTNTWQNKLKNIFIFILKVLLMIFVILLLMACFFRTRRRLNRRKKQLYTKRYNGLM